MNSTITTASQYPNGMRYYSLNQYCKDTFGQKTYRLSLDGGMTCPNRDGKLSTEGCYFCSTGGSGDFAASRCHSISAQFADAKSRIQAKTNCNKFIAYFQAFTNTYAPVEKLKALYTEAINQPEVVALSIGTRSDCIDDDVLDLLSSLNQIKPVWIELGFQTMHNSTHEAMNTRTSCQQFDFTVGRLKERGISVIAHLILGLPGENRQMMLESVRHIASLAGKAEISGIKLQLLHVLKGTRLADMYKENPFPIFELEEYCDFVIDCVELLPPDLVIHRLTGDGPRRLLIAPLWSTDKKRVLNTINNRFIQRNTYQGRLFQK